MALKRIACLCFFEKVTKNGDFWANHQEQEQPICNLSRSCRFSRLSWRKRRHRVGIPSPIHTRGSEDSVSLHKANSLKLVLLLLLLIINFRCRSFPCSAHREATNALKGGIP